MRTVSGVERLGVVTVAWVIAAVITRVLGIPWPVAALVGWDVGALAMLASVWATVGRFSPDETRVVATREDNSRAAASFLLLAASVASLAGAGFALYTAGRGPVHPEHRIPYLVISVGTVLVSWAVVHTVFALRYAHEYYTDPVGGIDFGAETPAPDYQDFAYLAFTVGMTFQTSDTAIQAHKVRRTVLRHALLAYLFGAVILAVVVNLIAGLRG